MTAFSWRTAFAAAASAALLAACSDGGEATATPDAGAENVANQPAQGENWVRTIEETDDGGFRIGNPDAPVKLVEFGSLSCSHCANFHEEAMTDLKGEYIASGEVSYELRPFVLNPPDYVATALARCTTPEAFYALADAFFENQQTWLGAFQNVSQDEVQRLGSMDPSAAMVEFGKLGGLDEFARARGIPASRYQDCVASTEAREAIEAIRTNAVETYNLTGTPTFVINGERIDAANWEQVEQELQQRL